MGTFGVPCSVQKLLWRRNIIVLDTDFTEICKDLRISAFGVCCTMEKKLFRHPWRMLLLPLAQAIILSLLVLSGGSPRRSPMLPLEWDRHDRECTLWLWG